MIAPFPSRILPRPNARVLLLADSGFCTFPVVHFQVLAEGRPRRVEFEFGSSRDLRLIGHWRAPGGVLREPAVRDTVEFARLAAKRHRHYMRSIPTAASVAEFENIIRQDQSAEIGLLFLVRAAWFKRSQVIGLAQCRRTFCNHLILEFLSVHPAIVGRLEPRVSGVGKGLVYGAVALASQLGIRLIWGEATALSAPFYSLILDTGPVDDRLLISGKAMERCCRGFAREFYGALD